MSRFSLKCLLGGAAVAGAVAGFSTSANAVPIGMVDMRVTSIAGGTANPADTFTNKSVSLDPTTAAGKQVLMTLYYQVLDDNLANDTITIVPDPDFPDETAQVPNPAAATYATFAAASIRTSDGGLLGNLAVPVVSTLPQINSPWNDATWMKIPTPTSGVLDLDADKDIGALPTASDGFFVPNSNTTKKLDGYTLETIDGHQYKTWAIGTIRMLVSTGQDYASGLSTDVTYLPRVSLLDGKGAAMSGSSDGTGFAFAANDPNFVVGAPINISTSAVPEPAILGLLGVGALSLVARRRRA